MTPLEVLITDNTLASYAVSELFARDVALSLKRRGHKPIGYSRVLGRVAADLRAAGIPVVSDLRELSSSPDIIHSQHNLETMTALLRFRGTPGIFFCHGYVPWQEHPPVFPRLLRYVAVDDVCLERLRENGIPPERAQVIYNFVDLQRFQPRPPLPPRPARALVFSNYAREDNFLPALRRACRRARIELDVAGIGADRPCYNPETLLPQYDLVFAKARAALEALAVGCAVITCDAAGLGAMVTTGNLAQLRPLNFGFRTLNRALEPALVSGEIARYNALDATEVSRRVRTWPSMEDAVDRLQALYAEVIQEHQQMKPAREEEEKAAAGYLMWLSTLVNEMEQRAGAHPPSPRRKRSRSFWPFRPMD